MKKLLCSLALASLTVGMASNAFAVEYVKICSQYGANYSYLPGTDICHDAATGDARQETEGGTWRSRLPYPEGKWTNLPKLECLPGRLINLGTFESDDFVLNEWDRKQTAEINPKLKSGEYVTKVIMSGGFYDPRIPSRRGANALDGLCVRSTDPGSTQYDENGPFNPPFGNDKIPIGCIANSRIKSMPAAYAISATSAFPNIDSFFIDAAQTANGPYTYGSRLVITTDVGRGGEDLLTYHDVGEDDEGEDDTQKPLAGKLYVSVCAEKGVKPNPH